jgi:hypothetical protein
MIKSKLLHLPPLPSVGERLATTTMPPAVAHRVLNVAFDPLFAEGDFASLPFHASAWSMHAVLRASSRQCSLSDWLACSHTMIESPQRLALHIRYGNYKWDPWFAWMRDENVGKFCDRFRLTSNLWLKEKPDLLPYIQITHARKIAPWSAGRQPDFWLWPHPI